jgi:hypothetical protein
MLWAGEKDVSGSRYGPMTNHKPTFEVQNINFYEHILCMKWVNSESDWVAEACP